jgi:DNA-binding PadR family transcriptional regulator
VSKNDPQIQALLPLAPTALHVLLALAEDDLHGYGMLKAIRRATDGRLDIGASTLYAVLKRLEDSGMVEEAPTRPRPTLDDERRRYFRLTRLGRDVLTAEIDRLAAVVANARALRLTAQKSGA